MGDTISSLVYRPPKPTHIDPNEFFYLDVDTSTPLCTSSLPRQGVYDESSGGCGSCIPLETGEADLQSLDRFFFNDSDSISGGTAGTVATKYRIPAFFVRRRGANQTLLFSHGNAEDLGMMYKRMKDLALVLCVNILAYDYTGYGLSEGGDAPNENMIYRNIEAAYKYLRNVRKIPASQIILYGRSLGSGPSCYMASKTAVMGDSVGGLILHSPFLSVYKVVADFGFHMAGDMFNNEKRAADVRCPTLIIHGKKDEVVPFWHAPRLLNAIAPEYRAQPFWVEGMGHNHIESRAREEYIQAISSFITKYVPIEVNPDGIITKRRRVPLTERASVDGFNENPKFYVNKTWVRHAQYLVQEAFALNDLEYTTQVTNSSRAKSVSSSTPRNLEKKTGTVSTSSNDKYDSTEENNIDDSRDEENEFAPWTNNHQSTEDRYAPVRDVAPRYDDARQNNTGFRRAKSAPMSQQQQPNQRNYKSRHASLQLQSQYRAQQLNHPVNTKKTSSKSSFWGKSKC